MVDLRGEAHTSPIHLAYISLISPIELTLARGLDGRVAREGAKERPRVRVRPRALGDIGEIYGRYKGDVGKSGRVYVYVLAL